MGKAVAVAAPSRQRVASVRFACEHQRVAGRGQHCGELTSIANEPFLRRPNHPVIHTHMKYIYIDRFITELQLARLCFCSTIKLIKPGLNINHVFSTVIIQTTMRTTAAGLPSPHDCDM